MSVCVRVRVERAGAPAGLTLLLLLSAHVSIIIGFFFARPTYFCPFLLWKVRFGRIISPLVVRQHYAAHADMLSQAHAG